MSRAQSDHAHPTEALEALDASWISCSPREFVGAAGFIAWGRLPRLAVAPDETKHVRDVALKYCFLYGSFIGYWDDRRQSTVSTNL